MYTPCHVVSGLQEVVSQSIRDSPTRFAPPVSAAGSARAVRPSGAAPRADHLAWKQRTADTVQLPHSSRVGAGRGSTSAQVQVDRSEESERDSGRQRGERACSSIELGCSRTRIVCCHRSRCFSSHTPNAFPPHSTMSTELARQQVSARRRGWKGRRQSQLQQFRQRSLSPFAVDWMPLRRALLRLPL
jgi:hypothetical protein